MFLLIPGVCFIVLDQPIAQFIAYKAIIVQFKAVTVALELNAGFWVDDMLPKVS